MMYYYNSKAKMSDDGIGYYHARVADRVYSKGDFRRLGVVRFDSAMVAEDYVMDFAEYQKMSLRYGGDANGKALVVEVKKVNDGICYCDCYVFDDLAMMELFYMRKYYPLIAEKGIEFLPGYIRRIITKFLN